MKKILDYIKDNKFRLIIMNNKINILNYSDIVIFDDNKIVIANKDRNIAIKGNNLVINKLYDQELLILGNILSIEFR